MPVIGNYAYPTYENGFTAINHVMTKEALPNPYWTGTFMVEVFRFDMKCRKREHDARVAAARAAWKEELLRRQAAALYHAEAALQDLPF